MVGGADLAGAVRGGLLERDIMLEPIRNIILVQKPWPALRLRERALSDHYDTDDSRTDICDLYIFPSSAGRDRSVLVLDINPDASALEPSFDPAASYELKIDTDGDLEADVAFHVLFALSPDGHGTAAVYRATAAAARGTGAQGQPIIANAWVLMDGSSEPVASNGYKFFAGLRSDPHFKDIKGFQNNFQIHG